MPVAKPTAKPAAKPAAKPVAKPAAKPAPNAPADWKETVKQLLEQLRPSLQADGGNLELVSIEDDGTVNVRLQGHCAGCPYSQMTLKSGIEQALKERVPQVREVNNV
jgi:Fe-S cluster biogenesis protein NfuA